MAVDTETAKRWEEEKNHEKDEAKTAIVVRDETDIFKQFDKLDDEVILAELKGRLTQSLVYHFAPKEGSGKEQWGIGKNGVDACSVELSKRGYILRDVLPITRMIDPTDSEYILIDALVEKYLVTKDNTEVKADSAVGTKRQWLKMKLHGGQIVPDPFWYEKGSQKALRNARLRLIPEDVKATIIAMAKEQNKITEVTEQESAPQKPAQPPKQKLKITIKLSDDKYVTEDLTTVYGRFEAIKKKLGEKIYREILGQFGYEKKNQIPHERIPDVYMGLIGAIKLGM